MRALRAKGYAEPLKAYIASGKPLMAVCVGMQVLFEGSDESDEPGLGVIPGKAAKFSSTDKSVPHMGWTHAQLIKSQSTNENDLL